VLPSSKLMPAPARAFEPVVKEEGKDAASMPVVDVSTECERDVDEESHVGGGVGNNEQLTFDEASAMFRTTVKISHELAVEEREKGVGH
jgi:hypothetical protein